MRNSPFVWSLLEDFAAFPAREPGGAEGHKDNNRFAVCRIGYGQRNQHIQGTNREYKEVSVPFVKYLRLFLFLLL